MLPQREPLSLLLSWRETLSLDAKAVCSTTSLKKYKGCQGLCSEEVTISNTIIVGDFNTPLTSRTSRERAPRQRISKETQACNDSLDQLDLTDIVRRFHSKAAEYTFFSSAQETFSRIDHILGHRASLGKFLKVEIIPCIVSNHNAIRLEINYKEKNSKKPKRGEDKRPL